MPALNYPSATIRHNNQVHRYARRVTAPALPSHHIVELPEFLRGLEVRGPATNVRHENKPNMGSSYDSKTKKFKKNQAGRIAHEAATWMIDRLGQGSYGTVYLVRVTKPALEQLRKVIRTSIYFVRHKDVREGATIALKLAPYIYPKEAKAEASRFIADNVREAATHSWLLQQMPVRVPGYRRLLRVTSHLPEFYFGGLTAGTDGVSYYVTMMGAVEGPSLWHVIKGGGYNVDVYLLVERAAASLWVNGMVHGDLHPGNIKIFGEVKPRAILLDLGRAVRLPVPFHQLILDRLACAVDEGVKSLGEIFWSRHRSGHGIDGLQLYVNGVMASRMLKLYYSDADILRRDYYNRLTAAEKAQVPQKRRELWGQILKGTKRGANGNANSRAPKRQYACPPKGR